MAGSQPDVTLGQSVDLGFAEGRDDREIEAVEGFALWQPGQDFPTL